MSVLKRLVRDESGQDLAEYGIALAVITLLVIAAVTAVGTQVNAIWQQAVTTLTGAV